MFGGGHFKGGFGGTGSSGRRSYSSSGFGSGFGQGADGYSSYSDFGSDYGSGFGTGADEANSLDVKAEVTVSFDEAAFGANKRVRLQGSDGKVQTLEIKIPAAMVPKFTAGKAFKDAVNAPKKPARKGRAKAKK